MLRILPNKKRTLAAVGLFTTLFTCILLLALVPEAEKANAKHQNREIEEIEAKIPQSEEPATIENKVCIVVRTSVSEKTGIYSVRRFLQSLHELNFKDWQALVFIADDRPFDDLQTIIQSLNDSRIRYFDNPLRWKWDPGEAAYTQTDLAITHCPPNYRWLLISNGDNYYLKEFLDYLDLEWDIIGTDFFSRWMHNEAATAWSRPVQENDVCAVKGKIRCFKNDFGFQKSDLGAQVFNLPRFRKEGRKFGALKKIGSQDGLMLENLVSDGWRTKRIPMCLFSHNPNEWSCHHFGGTFFERWEKDSKTEEIRWTHTCIE